MGSQIVKVINESTNPLPEYKTIGSAAMDIQAYIPEGDRTIKIEAGDTKVIRTGLKFEIPENYKVSVLPRSGLAANHGITVLNSPGTIDSDYRGELCIILHNSSDRDYTVIHSERVAQVEIVPVYRIQWEPVTAISSTERGEGGFGSTGKE